LQRRRHVVCGGDAMEHARDALELRAKALERLGPALAQLTLQDLEPPARFRRALSRRRLEQPAGLGHLGPDATEKVLLRGHASAPETCARLPAAGRVSWSKQRKRTAARGCGRLGRMGAAPRGRSARPTDTAPASTGSERTS